MIPFVLNVRNLYFDQWSFKEEHQYIFPFFTKYVIQEQSDRVYQHVDVTLRDSIVETLLLWNTTEQYKYADFDFMFLQFLLIGVFGGETLATGNLDVPKFQFVRNIFELRVDSDKERSEKFDWIVEKVSDQFKRKYEYA